MLAAMRTCGMDDAFKRSCLCSEWSTVYCLCIGKDIETYELIFQALINKAVGSLFQYFWQEWMTDERLPLLNVHNVNIRTLNHLEVWHNRLNTKAA
ncbi:hypothetical protein T4E_4983 [Trichinella pseudospiralis]|uniref:Uncharacterized protein n=1 Tax=Trichinella pseudospiralis TaxID=6337 RepID=A0A0V0Y1I3_TRIPS|nr:hypothetical protein T4E_2545 [Trichinella pseudospiralis]KRX96234.1 hypothetical protein T4E_4983 [Trichinella pseudospiralis]